MWIRLVGFLINTLVQGVFCLPFLKGAHLGVFFFLLSTLIFYQEGVPPLGPGIPLPPVVERARAAKQREMAMTMGAADKSTKFLLDDEEDDDDEKEEDAAALAAAEAEEDAAWAPFLVTTGTLEDMAGHDG